MSPSTTVMEVLASTSAKTGIVVEQAEDEIAAINMAIGASFAGARAMTGTSGGGFSLMVEALGLSGMAEIPLVVVDVQRPGPVTGLPTRTEQSDLKFVISASQGEFPRMVIAVRNHTDAFYQTARAFDIAERYQIPVILLSDQYLGDASATVPPFDLDAVRAANPAAAHDGDGEYLRYRHTESGVSPRLIPGLSEHLVTADSDEHDERGYITESAEVRTAMMDKRLRKIESLRAELQEPDFLGDPQCHTLLLGWGSLWGPLREAVELLGPGYGALVFGDIFPLPTKLLLEKAAGVRRILHVEQNATGQLAGLVREYTGISCHGSVLKYDGRQMSAAFIVNAVRKGEKQ
jgi:2-oxoglutarate ferredoxin oxidoreductase subunit alpha